jgi:hypothetical protein
MVASNPQAVAANWANRLAGSSQKITDGINSVNVAPGVAAARQKNVYVQNVTAAADKWARNTQAVSLADWQSAAINKGVPRIASGAQAAVPKFEQFMGRLLPYVAAGRAKLPPRGDINANKSRMNAWFDTMSQFKNNG